MPRLHRQIAALARNSMVRPGPDAGYADVGDDAWTGVDWGPLHRWVEVGGNRVHVVDTGPAGAGAPIVWIHGLAGVWQNWLLNVPHFMGAHRCIALDLPGFGESPMPSGAISISGYAECVDGVLEALGVECAVVVGNSMGGFIGADLAIASPKRVERLVLVSAAGIAIEHQRREPLLTFARMTSARAEAELAQLRWLASRPRLRRLALQVVVRYPETLSPALAMELMQGAGKPGFVAALDALTSYSFREHLEHIEVPVLIVWGENDLLVPVGDADRFARLIGPNARREVFANTGHMPMLERPGRFNALLERFLSGSDPAGTPDGPRRLAAR